MFKWKYILKNQKKQHVSVCVASVGTVLHAYEVSVYLRLSWSDFLVGAYPVSASLSLGGILHYPWLVNL